MPGAIWDAVTGLFDRRTLVQNLIRDYERLISRLDNAINGTRAQRDNLRDERVEMRSRFRSYTDGTGEVTTIYYEAVDNNRDRFNIVHSELDSMIYKLSKKRNEADSKLGQLRLLHQIELTQERAFTQDEIRDSLH